MYPLPSLTIISLWRIYFIYIPVRILCEYTWVSRSVCGSGYLNRRKVSADQPVDSCCHSLNFTKESSALAVATLLPPLSHLPYCVFSLPHFSGYVQFVSDFLRGFVLFYFLIIVYWFFRGREREKHCPWLGIEPATSCCTELHLTKWATAYKAMLFCFKPCLTPIVL